MSRLLISAAHKSSGKTTISIGLCAALASRTKVQPFKKGPDYIDPMWLSIAAGRPCYNLDFYTQSHQEIEHLVARKEHQGGISLIEGNKGLYDGLDLDGANSNAALAKLLNTPVVLVIDTRGMTRGIAPLLMGYQVFDEDVTIAGVIFNQVGGSRHESKLRAATEHFTDIPVLGAVRRYTDMSIDERHLGLVPSNEAENAQTIITNIARHIADDVNLDQLMTVVRDEPAVSSIPAVENPPVASPVRIAIAQDAAFGFYYSDDLEALQTAGVELAPFNAIRDTRLPENIHGLFIGGGFPESCMAELSANTTLRHDIRSRIEAGLPTYAECGGLMYLADSIRWDDREAAMVGVIPGTISMHSKPQGRGYIRIQTTAEHPWLAQTQDIAGHEFHHSRIAGLPLDAPYGFQVTRGTGIDGQHDGYLAHNLVASYAHLRNTEQCPWVPAFVDFVRKINFPASSRA